MSDNTLNKTFRAQGDTGVVYTVTETQVIDEAGDKQLVHVLADGRKVEKVGEDQFEIVETKELISVI